MLVSEPDEVRAAAEKLAEQIARSYADAVQRPTAARRRPTGASCWTSTTIQRASRRRNRPRRSSASTTTPGDPAVSAGQRRRTRAQPAGRRAPRPHCRLGRRRSASCATDGETVLFVAATPGRAERTIELLKEYDVLAVPVERADDARYAAVLVATGQLVARIPAARCRPADLRRSGRLRRRSPRARSAGDPRARRFSPICAT